MLQNQESLAPNKFLKWSDTDWASGIFYFLHINKNHIKLSGVATNSRLGVEGGGGAVGAGPNRDLFYIVSTKAVEKSLLLHHVLII